MKTLHCGSTKRERTRKDKSKLEESSTDEEIVSKPGLVLIENGIRYIPKRKLIKISVGGTNDKIKSNSRSCLVLKKKQVKKSRIITLGNMETTKEPEMLLKKTNVVLKNNLQNIQVLLSNSNATPIQKKGGIGYLCCFCVNEYVNPADLKKHTLNDHDEVEKKDFMLNVPIAKFMVKLDITDLECNKCKEKASNLEWFIEHLTSHHKIDYNTDIKSHIVPLRFEDESIHCVVCPSIFRSFKIALEHMNIHFRNYICETCGSGFTNRSMLNAHTLRHKTGAFTCTFCGKLFNTNIKKREHERAIHILRSKRNKCGYCGEKFTDYTTKNQHLVKMHGVKPTVLNCNACDKTFDNQRSLTVHTKNYHMVKRRTT